MSPFAYGYKEIKAKKNVYVLIEESLATAYALKVFSSDKEFSKLKMFVRHQPIQYMLGLKVFDRFKDVIELLMLRWRFEKLINDFPLSVNFNRFARFLFDKMKINVKNRENKELEKISVCQGMQLSDVEICLFKRIYNLYKKKINKNGLMERVNKLIENKDIYICDLVCLCLWVDEELDTLEYEIKCNELKIRNIFDL